MKFYNPFRWHIVEIHGSFYVRKLTLLYGFVYCDSKDGFVWTTLNNFHIKWSIHRSEEEARKTLSRLKQTARYVG